ncbi:Hypothetical Protein FCC1311_067602 [Hondaea fermentalgiana]|uniref:Uncharacterized protein n=1 Tax=Hondaea fermentalgiana TaxID=2315210 RepID=A0A2R5GI21_9STRA|nr:Hypothetical Protein FCC1311_067602 [Hondaea fermentalgiana]|eukprot:GBG30540.1 Hypothetical Protein FCC1311_067602 [Hondaea fermentalgiana]
MKGGEVIDVGAPAFKDAAPSKDGSRAAVRINPVTGKMTTVAKTKDADNMVREGSMYIPKEYLHAAAAAGLGSANGMYSHMSGLRRELNGGHNLAGPTRSGGAPRPAQHEPKVTRVAGNIHKIDTSSSSSSGPKRSNIKQVTQGRARSLRSGTSEKPNESSYLRQKGVINSFNGACSNLRTSGASKEAPQRKTGVAQLKFGSSGQSYITYHDGPIKHAHRVTPPRGRKALTNAASDEPTSKTVQRAAGTTNRLGGGSTAAKSSAGTNMSDREKRAAYFAQKFGAK